MEVEIMKMKFTEPQINIKMFKRENILTASGVPSVDPETGVKVDDTTNYDVHSIKWSDLAGIN